MIANPVSYSEAEQLQIEAALESEGLDSDTWTRTELASIRQKIKQHYILEQGYRCCYCQQKMVAIHGRSWDVEHIIPRVEKPHFMFTAVNLAISCIECNNAKGSVCVTTRHYVRFPKSSENYLIVHPHFDNYDEHIEIEGQSTYHALTPKGSFTIYHCDFVPFLGTRSSNSEAN